MTKQKIKLLLVGVGGYAGIYLDFFAEGYASWADFSLEGVVDPFAAQSRHYPMLRQHKTPIYETLSDFYREREADLAVIATPVPLHRAQCMEALAHHSHVLCEKPLVPTLADWAALKEAERASGCRLAVGFQWSFSQTMLRLKRDILAGRFGQPRLLKTLLAWPRDKAYYTQSTWKGRVHDTQSGQFVNDSLVSNATAHYLHNIFFLLGSTLDQGACPVSLQGEMYRTKDIETFDTCFLQGQFASGATFLYAGSHAGRQNKPAIFTYYFDDAEIGFNDQVMDEQVYVRTKSGERIPYGNPSTQGEAARKLLAMGDFIRFTRQGWQNGDTRGGSSEQHGHGDHSDHGGHGGHGGHDGHDGYGGYGDHDPQALLPCGIDTVRPHVSLCESLYRLAGHIAPLPETADVDIDSALCQVFDRAELPSACLSSFPWATAAQSVTLA